MALYPTPRSSSHPKYHAGLSDLTYDESIGTYKFMGATLLNINCSVGFNSVASSVSLNLVEDTDNGDAFIQPNTPSAWMITLPKGGVGASLFPSTAIDLNPDAFYPNNVSISFGGICTSWEKIISDAGGKTISVTLTDPREILKGVQCLLGGFALSQNIGSGANRQTNADNVIDCFGYFDYGMESGKNDNGMQWSKIKECLENVGVTVNEIAMEFSFLGSAFSTPSWYRINDNVIDILSLAQKVCQDSGSDLMVSARKVNSVTLIVEFRSIKRTNTDLLTKQEITDFIGARSSIVERAVQGREFRNEKTSSIITGGFRNKNYLALPSSYDSTMHLRTDTKEVNYFYNHPSKGYLSGQQVFSADNLGAINAFKNRLLALDPNAHFFDYTLPFENYEAFPPNIIVRLFGGVDNVTATSAQSSIIEQLPKTYDIDAGAIFPFWGFAPGGSEDSASIESAFPLIEPFLALDHFAFDKISEHSLNLTSRIPLVKIVVGNKEVRVVDHDDVFLNGDGDSDSRPFAYLKRDDNNNIELYNSSSPYPGYIRGIPLNTEILRAALAGETAFYIIYEMFFPGIAQSLGFPTVNIDDIKHSWDTADDKSDVQWFLENFPIHQSFLFDGNYKTQVSLLNNLSASNPLLATDASVLREKTNVAAKQHMLAQFRTLIWEEVKKYADEHMGRKFIVCLPKSTIMTRIFAGQPVPTRVGKPEIEYVVADRGYWETIPSEFDGLDDSDGLSTDQEKQILRRFQLEDGRFLPMAIMDWKPTGNASFNSNGLNKAMFQDLPPSDFRPNRIADGNPEYVFIACRVSQLAKRPDLAIVEIPPVTFDPTDGSVTALSDLETPFESHLEYLGTRQNIAKLFFYYLKKNQEFRTFISQVATQTGQGLYEYASKLFRKWADSIWANFNDAYELDIKTERVMDLKGVVIPLTSTWVTYGPWYYSNDNGMVQPEVDESLVPWNFSRPTAGQSWDTNLNAAGEEKLARTLSITDYIDTANITVAGFPEFNIGTGFGFNSNFTSISINFDIGGIKTIYNLSTYGNRPGTYRKSDYDDISKSRIDTRPAIIEPVNTSLAFAVGIDTNTNQFRN